MQVSGTKHGHDASVEELTNEYDVGNVNDLVGLGLAADSCDDCDNSISDHSVQDNDHVLDSVVKELLGGIIFEIDSADLSRHFNFLSFSVSRRPFVPFVIN